ncbi:MAG: hypothetical protein E6R06_32940 [Mycobacterium sp.]|nr:MAG: hypothetical protein E6R06_32940 [Mycobacterium sp.]
MAAAGPWTLTNAGRKRIIDRYIAGGSALTFKVGLYQSSSNIGAASTTIAAVTNEVANANGYATGGIAVTPTVTGTTIVTVTFAVNPVWTASGGNITARWAVLYEVGANVLAYSLLDSAPADVTATDSNTLTIDSDGTPYPVISLA